MTDKELMWERRRREAKIQRLCFEKMRKNPNKLTQEEFQKQQDKVKWDLAVKGTLNVNGARPE